MHGGGRGVLSFSLQRWNFEKIAEEGVVCNSAILVFISGRSLGVMFQLDP